MLFKPSNVHPQSGLAVVVLSAVYVVLPAAGEVLRVVDAVDSVGRGVSINTMRNAETNLVCMQSSDRLRVTITNKHLLTISLKIICNYMYVISA